MTTERRNSVKIPITEENEEKESPSTDDTGNNDDDETASKGSYNEKVMNTNINDNVKEENEQEGESSFSRRERLLRRKSLAPIKRE